jgi:hypothetical protein
VKTSSTVAVVLLVLATFFVWQIRDRRAPKRQFNSTQQFIDFLASEAVKDAQKENHVNLDFTVDSVKSVERILGALHDVYMKAPSSISVKGLSSAYGAYIGEVIRRSEPGARWERDDDAGGEKSYPIIWGPGHSYPMAWCYRRIVNGEEDNVWVKYSVLKEGKGQSSLLGPTK